MSGEEFWAPEIENNASALSQAVRQPPEQIAVRRCVEMTKALRHDDGEVVGANIGLIVADICLNVARAAGQFACPRNGHSITFNTGNRVTAAEQRPRMPPHPAADIDNFAEAKKRRASANKIDLVGCAGLGDADVKEFKPARRVGIRSNHQCSGKDLRP